MDFIKYAQYLHIYLRQTETNKITIKIIWIIFRAYNLNQKKGSMWWWLTRNYVRPMKMNGIYTDCLQVYYQLIFYSLFLIISDKKFVFFSTSSYYTITTRLGWLNLSEGFRGKRTLDLSECEKRISLIFFWLCESLIYSQVVLPFKFVNNYKNC